MMSPAFLRTLAALAWLCTNKPAGADPILFGTTGRTDSTTIATFIAMESKFFEAEKLEVEWITAGSAARAVQQTVAGSLNISIAATDATVRAFAEGAEVAAVDDDQLVLAALGRGGDASASVLRTARGRAGSGCCARKFRAWGLGGETRAEVRGAPWSL